MKKESCRVKIGVLGCGPIAQAAHLESCAKARNADLYAICDVAEDLLVRMRWTHAPERAFSDYDAMLSDPDVEAVIIATSDAFHVACSIRALEAGKHVLCEKPVAMTIEEALNLQKIVRASGKIFQVAHMRRFDPAIEAARDFIQDGLGRMIAFKGWYCDSSHRYTMTDAVQPLMVKSSAARIPPGNPKADRQKYLMLAHGSHIFDLTRYLAGEIVSLNARHREMDGTHCWLMEAELASDAVAQLDLTVPVHMDWHEGLQIYGSQGSVLAKMFSPWYFRASEVDMFSESDGNYHRPLAADGHHYRRQVEGFADVILNGSPQRGATIEDGVASVRAMVAAAESVRTGKAVELATVDGGL